MIPHRRQELRNKIAAAAHDVDGIEARFFYFSSCCPEAVNEIVDFIQGKGPGINIVVILCYDTGRGYGNFAVSD